MVSLVMEVETMMNSLLYVALTKHLDRAPRTGGHPPRAANPMGCTT
jgi:hypothetical protein